MANMITTNDVLPPLPLGEKPPAEPFDPEVEANWAKYQALRERNPRHPGAVWPPPTRRLRYHALDLYVCYGIAKGDGSLDPSTTPADKINLSNAEYKDWINVSVYGPDRKKWYDQRKQYLAAANREAEPMTKERNPFSKKAKTAIKSSPIPSMYADDAQVTRKPTGGAKIIAAQVPILDGPDGKEEGT